MKQGLVALGLIACAAAAWAQTTPEGLWRTTDEKTGQAKSEVRISEEGGVLVGRVEKLLRPGADAAMVCSVCTDDRKNQPMVGLEIIRGAHKAEGKDEWVGGKILDPENGKTYTLKITPVDGGDKLEVRGSVGPFGRTQTWVRVP